MIHIRLLSRVLGQQNFDSEKNSEKKTSTDKIRAVETNKQTNKQKMEDSLGLGNIESSAKTNIPNIRIFVCYCTRSFANEYLNLYCVIN